ncbi:CBM35 domain-containing protein [Streptomyces durmitorensis]|uniref:Carbohydrate-binding protein n=1 Tax=Streptomyces durmitorensis TaxID=319947 RepID=A0ABY4PXW4_9ACTN|nr:carbohydrate-binding protein [Streptomyces durmitorensis]UQT57804.1 carbohydrate-binding protein [Streptomyces durmitorensis]
MTPGNNGEPTPNAPEGDEDVFGYLYEDGQAAGATPPSGGGGYGYPGTRSSYNQVRAVGDRRPNAYGTQAAPTYGQQVPPQQQAYGQPNAHYAAPETQPGGAPAGPQYTPASRGSGGRGGGPNTKGLLIAAIAVVAVVAIGIAAAMLSGGGDEGGDKEAGGGSTQGETVKPSEKPTKDPADPVELPKTDAKALKLEGGTTTASDIEGAESAGGAYVSGFDKVGAQVTWTVNGIPKAGSYSLHVKYGVPGKDSNATILVNGKKQTRPLNMENFAKADEGDWEKGWTNTWAVVQLNKGTNAVTLTCAQSDLCGTTGANIDQMWLVEGSNG